MAALVEGREPVGAQVDELPTLADADTFLQASGMRTARLVGPDGNEIVLPESLVRVLRQAAHVLVQNEAVAVVAIQKLLTTNQAAELLNVSRQYLTRLLKRGDLPYTMVGSHHRIELSDLMEYKRVRDARREAALDELTRLSQDLGFYEDN